MPKQRRSCVKRLLYIFRRTGSEWTHLYPDQLQRFHLKPNIFLRISFDLILICTDTSSAENLVVFPTGLSCGFQARSVITHGVTSGLTVWLTNNPNPTFTLRSVIYMHTCILYILWSDPIMQSKQIWQLLLFLRLPGVCAHVCARACLCVFGGWYLNEANMRSGDKDCPLRLLPRQQSFLSY